MSTLRVEVFRRADRRWTWHAVDRSNGQIVGTDGAQGYENRSECLRMAQHVTRRAPKLLLDAEHLDDDPPSDLEL